MRRTEEALEETRYGKVVETARRMEVGRSCILAE